MPQGLSAAEAANRMALYGPNELAEKKTGLLRQLAGYFWAPFLG